MLIRINQELHKKNRGFSLLELLVALALLALLAAAIAISFNGARSKAQVLLATMSELGGANIRLKTDTGCYVNRPEALYSQAAAATAANNYCNRNFSQTWSGPYVSRFIVDTNGDARMDKVSSDVLISFGLQTGGIGRRYFTRSENVPTDVLREALQECNGGIDETAMSGNNAFNTYKCRIDLPSGAQVGALEMLYDETR